MAIGLVRFIVTQIPHGVGVLLIDVTEFMTTDLQKLQSHFVDKPPFFRYTHLNRWAHNAAVVEMSKRSDARRRRRR